MAADYGIRVEFDKKKTISDISLEKTTATFDDSTYHGEHNADDRDEGDINLQDVELDLDETPRFESVDDEDEEPPPPLRERSISSLRVMNDGVLQNTSFEPSMRTKILAVLFPISICIFCNLVYMTTSGIAQKSYLEFVEKNPLTWAKDRRLPDLVLDFFEDQGLHDSQSTLLTWTTVSDTFPLSILAFCTAYLIIYEHYLVINRCLLTQSFLISLNALAENLTILPSSYGYDRCLDYLGISHSRELPGVSLSPTGSCSAMIWSGHCVHTLISAHMLGCALGEDHPEGLPYIPHRVFRVVKPKTFLMIFLGLLEVLFLALARAMTNNSLKAIFLLSNPYVRSMIDPDELKLLQMPHGVLRERARAQEIKNNLFAAARRSNSMQTAIGEKDSSKMGLEGKNIGKNTGKNTTKNGKTNMNKGLKGGSNGGSNGEKDTVLDLIEEVELEDTCGDATKTS